MSSVVSFAPYQPQMVRPTIIRLPHPKSRHCDTVEPKLVRPLIAESGTSTAGGCSPPLYGGFGDLVPNGLQLSAVWAMGRDSMITNPALARTWQLSEHRAGGGATDTPLTPGQETPIGRWWGASPHSLFIGRYLLVSCPGFETPSDEWQPFF